MLRDFVLRMFPDDVGGGAAVADAGAEVDTAAADALAAADRADGDTPAAGSGDSIAEASRKFLAGLTKEQQARELKGPDDEELESDDIDTAPEGAAPEAITRSDGATWNVEAGRWQRADGAFVEGAAPEGAKLAPKKPAAVPAPKPEAAAAAAPASDAKVTKIVLPGLKSPGEGRAAEEDIEVEIDDPVVAERLARLKNDGLRRTDYDEKVAALSGREQRITEFEDGLAELVANPVGFALRQMTPERQLELAKALIVEHWDSLVPAIEQYNDSETRARALVDGHRAAETATARAAQERAVQRHVASCLDAAVRLVPDTADAATRRDFMADVRATLARAANAGERVTPDTVPTLIAARIKQYGFTPTPAATPAPAVPAKPAVPTARPVSDRARSIADAAADRTAAAEDTQRRLRSTQARRAAATRVAPAGAGAMPTQAPLLKPGEKVDIKSASNALRKSGRLPSAWGAPSE